MESLTTGPELENSQGHERKSTEVSGPSAKTLIVLQNYFGP